MVVGSAGKDSPYLHASPADLGWEKMVSFKHDFPGKEAIQKELEGQHNALVHLIWDAEDILKVAATIRLTSRRFRIRNSKPSDGKQDKTHETPLGFVCADLRFSEL